MWLAAAAPGLHRSSRVAYQLSLAGLILPLRVVAASTLGPGATSESFAGVYQAGADASTLAARLAFWDALSNMVNPTPPGIALVLAVTTAGLLLSGTFRRFFALP